MGTVAGAEPTAVVTGLANGDTTQVGADTWKKKVSEARSREEHEMRMR